MKLQASQILLGAAAGAVLVSVISSSFPDRTKCPDRSQEIADAIRELRNDLVREIASICMGSEGESARANRSTPGQGGASGCREAIPGASDEVRLPAGRPEALERLGDWDSNAEIRLTWMFATEERVLREFGAPDFIHAEGTRETWSYEARRDGQVVNRHILTMNRGRLIHID